MAEQTNADLIATAKVMREQMGEEPKPGSILGLWFATAERLEAADQLAEIRGETIRTYERENADWERRVHIAERKAAEYAAVVEKAGRVLTTDYHGSPAEADVLPILATARADALREVKADVWDEGVNAEAKAAVTASPRIPNPYREEQDHG